MRLLCFLLSFTALASPRAEACSCVALKGTQAEQVEQSFADAGAVFVARVTRSSVGPDRERRKVVAESALFKVLEVFKGPLRAGQTIRVDQILSAGTCGQSSTNDPPWLFTQKNPKSAPEALKISKKWLIYAYGNEPYELSRCTRSAPLNVGGAEDVKLLRDIARRTR